MPTIPAPPVIRAIYDAVEKMGFRSLAIFWSLPWVLATFSVCCRTAWQDSRLYGVELDSITGRIAQKLYPQADITVAGFETTDRRDFYDLAVGNVPFGQLQSQRQGVQQTGLHLSTTTFFAKAIDQSASGRRRWRFVTSRYHHGQQGQHRPQAHGRACRFAGSHPSAQQCVQGKCRHRSCFGHYLFAEA